MAIMSKPKGESSAVIDPKKGKTAIVDIAEEEPAINHKKSKIVKSSEGKTSIVDIEEKEPAVNNKRSETAIFDIEEEESAVNNKRSKIAKLIERKFGVKLGAKKKKNFSMKKVISAQKEEEILLAAMISVGSYAIFNLLLFVLYFVLPGIFQWTLFENWTNLSEYQELFHVLNGIWFALVFSGATLVIVGILNKRSEFLIPHLVLASIELTQIVLYSVAFFALVLLRGFFEETNYFGIESNISYFFTMLGTGFLMTLLSIVYFISFIAIVVEAKNILTPKYNRTLGVHDI